VAAPEATERATEPVVQVAPPSAPPPASVEAPLEQAAPPLGDASGMSEADAPPLPAGAAQPAAGVAQGPPAATPAPRTPELAAAANADFTLLERVIEAWDLIRRDVRPLKRTIEALLKDVRPIDVEENTIILLAASTFHKTNIEQPQNREILEAIVKKHLGATYAIRCTIEAKSEARDLRGQIREARKDELVRAAMNIFEAHIVDIEPED
jgi:DNA polymerase-3 subunit gamma/tau